MTDKEISCFEMFQRVIGLSEAEAARFASNPYILGLFDELGGVVTELRAHANTQATVSTASRQFTQNTSDACDEVLDLLSAMRRTARNIPGQEKEFSFSKRPRNQDLIILARAYAAKALPIKAEFIKRGMRTDFVEALTAGANTVEQSLSGRTGQMRNRVNATATIADQIEAGMRIVRELDTIMRNLFADDPGMLAAWISASHVERTSRRATPAPAPEPTT